MGWLIKLFKKDPIYILTVYHDDNELMAETHKFKNIQLLKIKVAEIKKANALVIANKLPAYMYYRYDVKEL